MNTPPARAVVAVLVALVASLSGCAVAPTTKPGQLSDRAAVQRLQRPNQQRNVYFRSEDSLFPRSRDVLLIDRPLVVAQALLGQLQKGPLPEEENATAVTTEFSRSWKFVPLNFSDGVLSVNVASGIDIVENAFPLCQMIYTLVDGRTIRSLRLFNEGSRIKQVRDPNGDLVDTSVVDLTRDLCSTLDKGQRSITILFVKNGKLAPVQRQVTGLTDASDPLDWTEQLITALVSGPLPKETETGFGSDVRDASPEFQQEGNGYALSFAPAFEQLPANRQAMVLAQLLDAIETWVPNKSFGAVAVEVGGVRKSRVAGANGPIATPIQRSQYLPLLPTATR
jgi:hypothetical protein